MQKFCEACGGIASDVDMSIRHDPNCPNHPDAIDDTPIDPALLGPSSRVIQQGGNVVGLALARVDTGAAKWPDDCPAMAALDMARDWVRKSGKNPDHVIVFLGKQTDDGADGIKFFQTGTYRSYAQVGMVHAGLDAMNQSGFAGYDE